MSSTDVTGTLRETQGEVLVEWQIPDFYSLSEVGSCYYSPVFYVCDECWRLKMYPRGKGNTLDWVVLYISRMISGQQKEVELSLAIKTANRAEVRSTGKITLKPNVTEYGTLEFISISDLLNRKSELTPSDVLTVTLKVKDFTRQSAEVSLFSRLWNLSRDLKTVLTEEKATDFVLKLEGREVRAHGAILEARCNYFAGMLGNDFQEGKTREVDISDIEEGVFQCVLSYLYTGVVAGMSGGNVCKVYVAADKLLLVDLKKMCRDYMKANLKVDLICDVIENVERYGETELKKHALDYFIKHADEVFESDRWKRFKTENEAIASGLLESIIVSRLKHLNA